MTSIQAFVATHVNTATYVALRDERQEQYDDTIPEGAYTIDVDIAVMQGSSRASVFRMISRSHLPALLAHR
jgi:hypothetical protein